MPASRSTQLLCSRLLSREVAVARQCSFRPSTLVATTTAYSKPSTRFFSNTPITYKKGGKAAREASRSDSSSSSSSAAPSSVAAAGSEDPFDFSALETDISDAIAKLKDDLSQLRQGGRFNPQVLESLRVQLKQGGAVKLGDLAQVVPKGRIVQVVAGEQEHLKPITSTIQSANLNLTPQPDATNPLLLSIPIPPPTAESRKATVNAAQKAGDVASNAVRNARQGQQKKLRAMQLAKSARPDDLKKAGAQMEKVVDKGVQEVKKIVDAAKRALDA
ncbi:ribosome recycling factor [Aureobasidium namibiae CBS 147.97]|uniref:Ribosome recycling factor n=1 Tax=Aureobasidium namibiae CBS 147.97 TaxID=1043004 RepID=A0A074X2E9_9PEZI